MSAFDDNNVNDLDDNNLIAEIDTKIYWEIRGENLSITSFLPFNPISCDSSTICLETDVVSFFNSLFEHPIFHEKLDVIIFKKDGTLSSYEGQRFNIDAKLTPSKCLFLEILFSNISFVFFLCNTLLKFSAGDYYYVVGLLLKNSCFFQSIADLFLFQSSISNRTKLIDISSLKQLKSFRIDEHLQPIPEDLNCEHIIKQYITNTEFEKIKFEADTLNGRHSFILAIKKNQDSNNFQLYVIRNGNSI